MADDMTVRVNEKWGLLAMVAVVAIAAGVVWGLGYWEKLEPPSTALPAAATQRAAALQKGGGAVGVGEYPRARSKRDWGRRANEPQGDYVQWPETLDHQGTTVIRVGNAHLTVSLYVGRENRKQVDAWWSYPRQDPPPRSWGTANMVMRVLATPQLAAKYDFTAEQLEQLKTVKFPM